MVGCCSDIDEKAGEKPSGFSASLCGLFLTRDVFHDIAGLAIEQTAQLFNCPRVQASGSVFQLVEYRGLIPFCRSQYSVRPRCLISMNSASYRIGICPPPYDYHIMYNYKTIFLVTIPIDNMVFLEYNTVEMRAYESHMDSSSGTYSTISPGRQPGRRDGFRIHLLWTIHPCDPS